MDMCRRSRHTLVLARHTTERNVVADGVLGNVNAVSEQAYCSGLSWGGLARGGNDLLRSSFDCVCSIEVEGTVVLSPDVAEDAWERGRSSECEGSGDETDEGGGGEVHCGRYLGLRL